MNQSAETSYVSTRNPCKVCAPLGASMAFAGVNGAIPLLHGSQGCSTYIRRYLIGHFREPMDIASSNFHENAAIFGGRDNLKQAIINVIHQYEPQLIGIATTCLAETIGEDVPMLLHEIRKELRGQNLPEFVSVSTPSYQGSHSEGFHATVLSLVRQLAKAGDRKRHLNLLPGMLSPADLRYLRDIFLSFGVRVTVLPDYSDTLDGPAWEQYHRLPPGGTSVKDITRTAQARASIEFTTAKRSHATAGAYLDETFQVPRHFMPPPMGVKLTDRFFATIEELTCISTPREHVAERGRLLDAMVDGHKYVFGKRALVYGEEDLVVGLVAMLAEAGIKPVLCATGGTSGDFEDAIRTVAPELPDDTIIRDDVDFKTIEELAEPLELDLVVGNSNGYKLARKRDLPLIRVGLPVHDRLGAARILRVGYRGTQQLYDRIVNALIERQQDESSVGYTHI